ncbi:MAG: LysR substrate-binding domain-containing protein [Silvibacterium sp.]
MELRHLRYFVAVAQEQNVSRAAKSLHVSQPPLSRQIRDLENDLGIALFEHSAKAIRLTPAGRIFLSEARAVLQRADDAVAFTKAVAHRKRTRIRVGYSFYAATEFLPRALLAFQRTNPGVRVDLSTMPTQDMLRGLRSGSLDVALLRYELPENFQGLSVEELGRYPLRVASHKKHRFARLRAVPMNEVAMQPIVAFSRKEYPDYHVVLARLLSPYNPSLNIVEEYESVPSLIAALEAGQGISIVNQSMSRIAGERVVLRPLKPAPEPARYVLAYRKEGVSSPIASFVKAARTTKPR